LGKGESVLVSFSPPQSKTTGNENDFLCSKKEKEKRNGKKEGVFVVVCCGVVLWWFAVSTSFPSAPKRAFQIGIILFFSSILFGVTV